MKKRLIAILTSLVVLLSFIGPVLYINMVEAATDPAEWYMTVSGVLDSDYYSLYPYEKNSLTIGFSKFGEMIDPITGTGLNYSGRDPFANEGISMDYWLNGWFIEIRYTHRTYRDRYVWAYAMFADMAGHGGDWVTLASTPTSPPYGGRKTNVIAWSEPITVLYDGPRRFVAKMVTHINDTDPNTGKSWSLVDVIFTIMFNKVKKYVIVFKDVKLTIDSKILDSPVDIQFSNRGEWDLGPSPEWKSYAHFYHQKLRTCYGADWHMSKKITREYKYHVASFTGQVVTLPDDVTEDPKYSYPVVWRSERVYVDGVFQEPGVDYTIDYRTGTITFTERLYGQELLVYYKLHKVESIEGEEGQIYVPINLPHQYDLVQMISDDPATSRVVGFAAFWPILSDYTPDGWSYVFQSLINVDDEDMLPFGAEPDIPFVIGEWDFMLDYAAETPDWDRQFRGVTVYGIVNWHDADDWNADKYSPEMGSFNIIDREVMYLLNEVFNPWDLLTAVHKPAARWVEFANITSVGETFTTDIENVPVIVRPDPGTTYLTLDDSLNETYPDPTEWDQYSIFSERIINLDTGVLLTRGVDYDIVQNSDGTATITFYVTGYMKILYSTMGMYWTTVDNANNATIYGSPDNDMDVYLYGTDPIAPIEFYILTPNPTHSWKMATLKIRAFDVDLEDDEVDAVYLNGHLVGILQGTGNAWSISEFEFPGDLLNTTGMQLVQIFVNVNYSEPIPDTINPTDPTTWPNMTDNWAVKVDWGSIVFNYDEHTPMPRYEWVTVGRDAHSADSIGASLVSAAFKNKQIEIGNAGFDMIFQEWGNTSIPYLLRRFGGTVPGWPPDYKDDIYRIALRDDWCHTWPVSSSNIICVGGPLANHITEYFNDFTDAFYGLNTIEAPFTPYAPWAENVIALSCWTKNVYSASDTMGYAVIATYKDINGTVGFLIWGINARDTFYACKFFHEEIIFELQNFPPCATSIIIQIDYTDPEHPTFTIPEVLGTISETTVEQVKGGIHDP